MALIFLAIACFIITVSSECGVVINELNKIDKIPESASFIELKSTCESVSLRGYKLIGFQCHGTTGKISLVANLWNARTKNRFYTIGGSEIDSDMNIPSDNIKFTSGFKSSKKTVQSVSNFFVQQKLNAIGLLYGEKQAFNEFKLSEQRNEIVINDEHIEILKKYLIDIVVYGGQN